MVATALGQVTRDFAQGGALGLAFITLAGAPANFAGQILQLPLVLVMAVVISGVLPFALGFVATGLARRGPGTDCDPPFPPKARRSGEPAPVRAGNLADRPPS